VAADEMPPVSELTIDFGSSGRIRTRAFLLDRLMRRPA